MQNRKRAVYEGLFWLGLVFAGFVLSYQFDKPVPGYRYGATGWARAVLTMIAVFALIQTAWGLLFERERRFSEDEQPVSAAYSNLLTIIVYKVKRFFPFIVPIGYVFLLPRAGFYVLTPVFVSFYMYLLGERSFIHLLLTMFLVVGGVYLIFTRLLFVPLPVGNWPGCYELNCMLVNALSVGRH
jgi:hypothetical protein